MSQKLKELPCEGHPFGYRRQLVPEGWKVNWEKLCQTYREEGLIVRKRVRRRQAIGTWARQAVLQGTSQRSSPDPRHCLSDQWRSKGTMSDSLSDGRRFQLLYVIGDFSRACLAAVVDTHLSGQRVARELDHIVRMPG